MKPFRTRSLCATLIAVMLCPALCGQQNSLEQFQTSRPAPVESRVPAAQAFTEPTAPKPGVSKTKLSLILLGVGAAVTGILLANRSSTPGAVRSPVPPAGTVSTVVVINGVRQP